MEISWPTHRRVVYGGHLGYGLANSKLREALASRGVRIRRRAKIVFHLCRADVFKPIKKRKNILFTMYEGTPVPESFAKSFAKADLLLTPSYFCKDMFDPLCNGKSFSIVPLGLDGKGHVVRKSSWVAGETFVWLWVGAPNARKGWDTLIKTWQRFFAKKPWMHLFLKTTSPVSEGTVETFGNVTFDSRRYTDEGLLNLYAKCDAFVLPTAGEGWGLTLTEAAAAGLPLVTTRHGGQVDFLCDKSTYFVDYKFKRITTNEGTPFDAAIADELDLARQMINLMNNYEDASSSALEYQPVIVEKYTWENSAKKIISLIEGSFTDEK